MLNIKLGYINSTILAICIQRVKGLIGIIYKLYISYFNTYWYKIQGKL